jgi:hypothetical protein
MTAPSSRDVLSEQFCNGAIEWVLSDGRTVRDVTARAAVAYPGVVGDGALPLIGGPSQTYRLIEQ